MKHKADDETTAFVMAKATQYHRVSTESDEETVDLTEPIINSQPPKQTNSNKNSIRWNCECISRLIVLYFMFMVAFGFAISRMPAIHGNHTFPPTPMNDHHHVYTKAAVAAGHPECSKVGVAVLQDGGNAVDAAIAALLCEGVVEPQFNGIGGGFFMVIYNKTTSTSIVIDARESAPGLSFRNMLRNVSKEALTIAVPGALKGFSHAYHAYGGDVSWKRLFDAAIQKAKNGFRVGEQLALNLEGQKEKILKSKALCDIYCDGDRKGVKRAGELVRNPELASTLKLLSDNGVDSFYNSRLTDEMVKDINREGGILSKKDFQDYKVRELEPLRVNLSSNMVLLVPPLPSGGPLLGLILSVIDSYRANSSLFDANETLYWHRTVESFKHAFGLRTRMGDPQFVSGSDEFAASILTPEMILNVRRKIVDSKTFDDPSYYGAKSSFENNATSSTTHLAVLAPNGDAVSVTSTINYYFGSTVVSNGVLFNNEMEDFATEVDADQYDPNMIEPHKRPLSSISPSIVVDASTNEVVYIIGAAGGRQIPTSIAMSLLRLLYFGAEDFDDAIRKPRLHHQLLPNILYYEKEFNSTTIQNLEKIGHKVQVQNPRSHVNGIKNHVSHIHAFSDVRNKGAEADGW